MKVCMFVGSWTRACVGVCMCKELGCIYACVCKFMFSYVCTCVSWFVFMRVSVYVGSYKRYFSMYAYLHMCPFFYAYMNECMSVFYAYMSVCPFLYVYVRVYVRFLFMFPSECMSVFCLCLHQSVCPFPPMSW